MVLNEETHGVTDEKVLILVGFQKLGEHKGKTLPQLRWRSTKDSEVIFNSRFHVWEINDLSNYKEKLQNLLDVNQMVWFCITY